MNDKEKIEALEEEINTLRKRITKLSANGIRNMDARLENIENKHDKIEDCFRYLFNNEKVNKNTRDFKDITRRY